jgi:hypothetical protein
MTPAKSGRTAPKVDSPFVGDEVSTSTQEIDCDRFVQTKGVWVPNTVNGPVAVTQTLNNGVWGNTWCSYLGPTPGDNIMGWWWNYMRGRWPVYRQPRFTAGSNINASQQMIPSGAPTNWAVVHQKVLVGPATVLFERFFALEGTGQIGVQLYLNGAATGPVVSLSANQYTEVLVADDGTQSLAPAAVIPGAIPGELRDAGYFVQQMVADALGRNLPQGVPCP